jgi:hypothetical protein
MLDHYSEDLGVGSQEDGAVGHFMEDARVAGEGDAPREGKALPMIADVSVGLQGSSEPFIDPDRFDLVVGGRRLLFSYPRIQLRILGSLSAGDS